MPILKSLPSKTFHSEMRSNQTVKYFASFIKSTHELTGRERKVLIKRLKSISLERVGNKFAITEARVRQIEKIALKKIKSKTRQLILFKKGNPPNFSNNQEENLKNQNNLRR